MFSLKDYINDHDLLKEHDIIKNRNIWITPTKFGVLLMFTLMILLIVSINYHLNLGFAFTFLLIGCVFTSIYISHSTLNKLNIKIDFPDLIFADEDFKINIQIDNLSKKQRYAVNIFVNSKQEQVFINIPGQSNNIAQLNIKADKRGIYLLPLIKIETQFPFGIICASSRWKYPLEYIVYPKPEVINTEINPLIENNSNQGKKSYLHNELDGIRPYKSGDPLKNIIWKKTAKTGELVSHDHTTYEKHDLWFDYNETNLTDKEEKLSRLCSWILNAHQKQMKYGLIVEQYKIHPEYNLVHLKKCLRTLALL